MSQGEILVIDDEQIIRSLLEDFLVGEGYSVTTCEDGEEGFQEAMKKEFDLLMMDVNLPGDDGIKITEHIKKMDPDTIVIIMTGTAIPETINDALRVGAFDYITKPFEIEKIAFAVKRAMNERRLKQTNKRLLKELAAQNRGLEEKVEERTERLTEVYEHVQEVYIRVIRTLVSAIEAKDAYTSSHSENVAKYSVIIAKEMGLSQAQIELIEKAAYLHDIGKIGIYDSVLNKPGKLTDEEFELVRQHPLKAKEILEPLDFLEVAIELIMQHHERYDGKGYPNGLKGEEISLGARIMGVADAYDAMVSGRQYRKRAFSNDDALIEIQRNKGTQFDPKVVEAFERCFPKI